MARTDTLTAPQASIEIARGGYVKAMVVDGVVLPLGTIVSYVISREANGAETLTVTFVAETTVTRSDAS